MKMWKLLLCSVVIGSISLAPQTEAQTLSVTNNLRYWFKADAITGLSNLDPVSLWVDSSTNGNNASQSTAANRPIYISSDPRANNQPVVRFDGLNDTLIAPATFATTGITAFVVGSYDHLGSPTTERFLLHLRATNFNHHVLVRAKDFGGILNKRFSVGFGGDQVNPTVPEGATNRFNLHTVFNAGGNVNYVTNGVFVGTDSIAAYNTLYTNFYLGSEAVFANSFLDGDIAEVLIFDTVLTASERNNVDQYIFAKYSIPEPTVVMLLAIAGVVALRRRRS